MSSSKLDTSDAFAPVLLESPPTRLLLAEREVVFRRNGLEFLTPTPLPVWSEVMVDLGSGATGRSFSGSGVVVDCSGDPHTGYVVSLLLLNLTHQSADRLQQLAAASAS